MLVWTVAVRQWEGRELNMQTRYLGEMISYYFIVAVIVVMVDRMVSAVVELELQWKREVWRGQKRGKSKSAIECTRSRVTHMVYKKMIQSFHDGSKFLNGSSQGGKGRGYLNSRKP